MTMETHPAGQEEKLMEVVVEEDQPKPSPADRPGCFRCVCALAAVMGLVVVALAVAFSLHVFVFMQPCNQSARPKVTIVSELHESDVQGSYDIFTVEKPGTYNIYGWVMLSDVAHEEVTLVQTWNGIQRTIQKQNAREREVFFMDKVQVVKDTRISVTFHSGYTDCMFLIHEL